MRRTLLAGSGAVGAAALGALCCVGPLIFVTFGVGAGLASTFEPLRPLFGIMMVVLFALAFYSVYGTPPASSKAAVRGGGEAVATGVGEAVATGGGEAIVTSGGEAACAAPRSRTREKAILWLAVLVALVLWTFPTWSVWLV